MIRHGILLLALALPAQAQTQRAAADISRWCGINNFLPSTKIDSCEAQNAENVLTDDNVLRKFPGAIDLISSVLSGYAIKGLWQFVSNSGTKYVIIHASSTIYSTSLSAAPVAIGTTPAAGSVDAVQAFGKIFFTDGTSPGWYYDGTSTASVAGFPVCKYIEFADERLYCANTSVSTSRVNTSSAGSSSWWVVPSNVSQVADAPNTFDFKREDGDPINCLKVTPWGKFIGKTNSSHILKGYDNDTYYKVVVSPNIGCVDDRSVQMVDGFLTWLSREGVYSWSGAGPPQLISNKIRNSLTNIGQATSQNDSWAVTSGAEWGLGSVSTNSVATWDFQSDPGRIFPASNTFNNVRSSDFLLGTNSGSGIMLTTGAVSFAGITSTYAIRYEANAFPENDGWTMTNSEGLASIGSSTFTWSSTASQSRTYNKSYSIASNLGHSIVFRAKVAYNAGTSGWAYFCPFDGFACDIGIRLSTYNVSYIDAGAPGSYALQEAGAITTFSTFTVVVSTFGRYSMFRDGIFKTSGTIGGGTGGINMQFYSFASGFTVMTDFFHLGNGTPWPEKTDIPAVSTYTSRVYDTKFDSPIGGSLFISTSLPTGTTMAIYIRTGETDPPTGAYLPVSSGTRITAANRYQQFRVVMGHDNLVESPGISQAVITYTSTGTYYSPVQSVGTDISAWTAGHFSETDAGGGHVTYQVRAGTYSFPTQEAAPSWTAHTNHTNLTIATGSYVQYRAISSLGSSTDSVSIADSLIEWSEGSAPPAASLFHDHRYWLCLVTDSSGTANNACFVLQKNNEWTKFNTKSFGAMTMFDGYPIAGSGSTDSNIWKIMRTDEKNFAGTTIAGLWRSKDFGDDAPGSNKVLREIWLDLEPWCGSDLDVAYPLNRSEARYTMETVDLSTTSSILEKRLALPNGNMTRGRSFRLLISNDDLDEQFGVIRATMFYDVEPRYQ